MKAEASLPTTDEETSNAQLREQTISLRVREPTSADTKPYAQKEIQATMEENQSKRNKVATLTEVVRKLMAEKKALETQWQKMTESMSQQQKQQLLGNAISV